MAQPSHKQASITPLPLPFPSSSPQNNMFHIQAGRQKHPKSYLTLSDHLEKRLSDDGCYDSCDMNHDSRVQTTAQIFANYRGNWNNMVETSIMLEDDDSGVSTPPLWRTSPSRNSPPHRQNNRNNNYRCLSPSSKAQAIARGQRELMEMVSKMPESCYELSLKDLVENQHVLVEPKQDSFAEGRDKQKKKKQRNQKPQIKRSGSMDNNGGFLLKMVFPISLGSKKKKMMMKSESSSNYNSKPTVLHASGKSVEKEWWKKRSGSSESESSGSTLNSGSTKSNRSSSTGSSGSSSCRSISISSRRHKKSGCLAFLLARRSKTSR